MSGRDNLRFLMQEHSEAIQRARHFNACLRFPRLTVPEVIPSQKSACGKRSLGEDRLRSHLPERRIWGAFQLTIGELIGWVNTSAFIGTDP